jgi:hypothetical protein
MRASGTNNSYGERLIDSVGQLSVVVNEGEALNKKLDSYFGELSVLESKSIVLTVQIETHKEQIQQVHEITALGLPNQPLGCSYFR